MRDVMLRLSCARLPFQCPLAVLHALVLGACLAGLCLGDGVETGGPSLWGTYRPHALMSVRARRPHSPSFGFMYHGAYDSDVRHLASDHDDKVTSFGFQRHDGSSFADHEIVDRALNAAVSFSFVKHHASEHAWAVRVSGRPLDPKRRSEDISMVFYAAAGPEEDDAVGADLSADVRRNPSAPWGTLAASEDNTRDDHGFEGDFVIDGNSRAAGGIFRVIVKDPATSNTANPVVQDDLSTTSSVSKRKSRARRYAALSRSALVKNRFHAASPRMDVKKAFLVDTALQLSLRNSDKLVEDAEGVDEDGIERKTNPGYSKPLTIIDDLRDEAPVVLVQRLVSVPFELEVVFASATDESPHASEEISELLGNMASASIERLLSSRRRAFDAKLDRMFNLAKRGYSPLDTRLVRSTLSNVLGGIGYFYGGTVLEGKDGKPVLGKSGGLLTATPSRALFPRGFMWDEGFHQLIVQRWDPELSEACLISWFDTMDDSGWIPREQVRGLEARHRFPAHVRDLMVQKPSIANPPTLLLPLRFLLMSRNESASSGELGHDSSYDDAADCNSEAVKVDDSKNERCAKSSFTGGSSSDLRDEVYIDKLTRYYAWLSRTQHGAEPESFRWRGRSDKLVSPNGYPLTLASGLDDFPRGYAISPKERHVDLHCWIAWACRILSDVHRGLGLQSTELNGQFDQLLVSLEKHHGLAEADEETEDDDTQQLLCDFDGKERFCEVGYVTILPLALGLLEPSDTRVSAILQVLEDDQQLRSVAGVRSLSKRSHFYRKGDDYWTGSVWMPFNYLVLSALRTKYSREDGLYKERATKLFKQLEGDIIANTRQVYEETGMLWENYSPDDGNGKSGRQFTGWTALIILIYGDMYEGIL